MQEEAHGLGNCFRTLVRRLVAQTWGCKVRSSDIAMPASEIHNCSTDLQRFDVAVSSLQTGEGGFGADVRVCDGLCNLAGPVCEQGESSGPKPQSTEKAEVRSARLLLAARIRNATLHGERQIRVSSLRTLGLPGVHSVQWADPATVLATRTVSTIPDPAVRILDSEAAISEPRVSPVSRRWRELPHSRRGVQPEEFSRQDQEGFLGQAESLRGVTAGQGEIVAVFRRVPVELITRARYSEVSGGLIYALASVSRRSRTRIHDVAAVRDKATGKIHLVPHKTRCNETVFN